MPEAWTDGGCALMRITSILGDSVTDRLCCTDGTCDGQAQLPCRPDMPGCDVSSQAGQPSPQSDQSSSNADNSNKRYATSMKQLGAGSQCGGCLLRVPACWVERRGSLAVLTADNQAGVQPARMLTARACLYETVALATFKRLSPVTAIISLCSHMQSHTCNALSIQGSTRLFATTPQGAVALIAPRWAKGNAKTRSFHKPSAARASSACAMMPSGGAARRSRQWMARAVQAQQPTMDCQVFVECMHASVQTLLKSAMFDPAFSFHERNAFKTQTTHNAPDWRVPYQGKRFYVHRSVCTSLSAFCVP